MIQKVLKLFFVIFLLSYSSIQAQTVTGTITDATDGTALPGVNIVIKGTTTGVSSDFDGKYSINVDQGGTLVFSFVGYTTKEVAVGASNSINVILQEDAEALEMARHIVENLNHPKISLYNRKNSSNVPIFISDVKILKFLGCSLKHRLLWQSSAAWRSWYCS